MRNTLLRLLTIIFCCFIAPKIRAVEIYPQHALDFTFAAINEGAKTVGYVTLITLDKVGADSLAYEMVVYDENLDELSRKKFTDEHLTLKNAFYSDTALCLVMISTNDRLSQTGLSKQFTYGVRLSFFDLSGNLLKTWTRPLKAESYTVGYNIAYRLPHELKVIQVEGKGFFMTFGTAKRGESSYGPGRVEDFLIHVDTKLNLRWEAEIENGYYGVPTIKYAQNKVFVLRKNEGYFGRESLQVLMYSADNGGLTDRQDLIPDNKSHILDLISFRTDTKGQLYLLAFDRQKKKDPATVAKLMKRTSAGLVCFRWDDKTLSRTFTLLSDNDSISDFNEKLYCKKINAQADLNAVFPDSNNTLVLYGATLSVDAKGVPKSTSVTRARLSRNGELRLMDTLPAPTESQILRITHMYHAIPLMKSFEISQDGNALLAQDPQNSYFYDLQTGRPGRALAKTGRVIHLAKPGYIFIYDASARSAVLETSD